MDATKFFEKELKTKGRKFDITVLDPPRKGCSQESLDYTLQLTKKEIIYVSCNPATFARDAEVLVKKGYKIKEINPVDQFVFSHHLELVCLFYK